MLTATARLTTRAPKGEKPKNVDNQTVNDSVLGEFVINYILNMLNAKKEFSGINSPGELEKRLLFGRTFSGVEHIEENGNLFDFALLKEEMEQIAGVNKHRPFYQVTAESLERMATTKMQV